MRTDIGGVCKSESGRHKKNSNPEVVAKQMQMYLDVFAMYIQFVCTVHGITLIESVCLSSEMLACQSLHLPTLRAKAEKTVQSSVSCVPVHPALNS